MAIDLSRETDGVKLPPEVANEIWANTRAESAIMSAAREISLPGQGVNIPIITGDPKAEWVGETEEKPVSRSELDNKTMTAYTIAVIEPFSNQFKRDLPGLYSELKRRLPSALAKTFDGTVFGDTSAPGSNFDRLKDATELSVSKDDTFDDLAAILGEVAENDRDLSHWLASPKLHSRLLTASDQLGRQYFLSDPSSDNSVGSIFGSPVVKTRSPLPGDTIGFAGDFAESAIWGSVEGVKVDTSDQATLKDGDDTLNLWQRNMFALRAEIEVGFRVRSTDYFVQITDGSDSGES